MERKKTLMSETSGFYFGDKCRQHEIKKKQRRMQLSVLFHFKGHK